MLFFIYNNLKNTKNLILTLFNFIN